MILSSVLRLCSKPRSGWHGARTHRAFPQDARVSFLIRFLMRRPPSEDDFLFTCSRIGLLRSGVPERGALLADYTPPPGFSPSCDFDPPRSRKVTLLPPLSPFGPVPALLPFLFQGRFDCSLHRPPVVCSSIAAFLNYLHRMCVEGLVRPALHCPTVMGHSSSGSLRSPCGFQCFPLEEIIQGAELIVPSELIPALASRHLL